MNAVLRSKAPLPYQSFVLRGVRDGVGGGGRIWAVCVCGGGGGGELVIHPDFAQGLDQIWGGDV